MSALLLESSAAQRLPDGIALQRMPIFDNISIPMPFIIDQLQPSIISVSSPSIIDRSQNTTQFTIDAEATSLDSTVVRYGVTAEDNVDGTVIIEEDGTTIIQDDVGGNIVIDCSPDSPATFSLGTHAVDCTAVDEMGNRANETFRVNVVDTTPPSLDVPENMVIETNSPTDGNSTLVTYAVSAEDVVDGVAMLEENSTTIRQDDVGGNIVISCDPPSASRFTAGTHDVSCAATDESGNTAERIFEVSVHIAQDTEAPVISIIEGNMTGAVP